MLGAIAGDIVGSRFEHAPIKHRDFTLFAPDSRFTDDSVCSIAVADALLGGGDFAASLRRFVRRYPNAGYGGMFLQWAFSDDAPPYGSWGNGAPMRIAPVGHAAADEAEVLELAERASAVSHDHPAAIAGAQAVALAIHLARGGAGKTIIANRIAADFGYDLETPLEAIRPGYRFDVSTAGTVPPALRCVIEAESWEEAVRNAVSLGGDADTLACIAGGVAEVVFGLPEAITRQAKARLTPDLLAVLDAFEDAYQR